MRQKIVTIRDVAKQAGVSVSTVSHVLNGNAQHVSSEKRELILEVMDRLKYRPNAIARSMVKQKTATIGLVISELNNPLFVPVAAGVEEVLRPAGYHIVLASSGPDANSERQAIETLRSQQVDGFIFMALSLCFPYDHLIQLKEEGVPFVVINRFLEDQEINQVSWDDRGTAYLATRHLLQLGYTRIGTISGPLNNIPPRRSALERHQGWLDALQEQGLVMSKEWIIDGLYTYEGGYQAIVQLLEQEGTHQLPDALFIASDMMAVAALKALNTAGIRVPEDIAVMGIGDPPFAAYTLPALSTFVLPVPEAGRRAAHILLENLAHGQESSAQQVTLSCTMQIRESCGARQSELHIHS